jgi:hypothetical protein
MPASIGEHPASFKYRTSHQVMHGHPGALAHNVQSAPSIALRALLASTLARQYGVIQAVCQICSISST